MNIADEIFYSLLEREKIISKLQTEHQAISEELKRLRAENQTLRNELDKGIHAPRHEDYVKPTDPSE